MLTAVVASAALHATWNFLLRRAGGGTLVVALSKVAEALLLLPAGIAALIAAGATPMPLYGPLVLVAALLALGNYAALAAAYRRADLSLVYPVARGGTFLFLPFLGFLAFGERQGPSGWAALGLIIAGIALLPLARFDLVAVRMVWRELRSSAMLLALLAALATAGYTAWDKYAVGSLPPFLYFYGYTVLLASWFGVVVARAPRAEVRATWAASPVSIVLIGLLNAGAYLLVLLALREAMPTQVLAVRQLSIPMGVALGWRLLHERLSPPRAIGALLVTAGCALAAAA